MTRLPFFVLICVFAFSQSQNVRKPNVVVFLVDDLGIGDVGCFGNNTIKTPNIDRLAANGAKLSHNLAPESICTPSRAAFLTGRYPIRTGLVPNPNSQLRPNVRVLIFTAASGGLPQNETTFAKILSESGYKTGLIGKWHLGLNSKQPNDFVHHPLNHGFQYFYGLPLTNLRDCEPGESVFEHIIPWFRASTIKSAAFVFALLALTLYSVGFIQKKVLGILFFVICLFCACLLLILGGYRVLNCFLMRDFEVVEQPVTLENLTVKFTDEAVTFIQENKHTPFMLFMSFAKVHTALFTTKPFTNHSKHGRYGDNVEEMDWSVGQIMNAIEDLGLKEDTFVYFTSDNGPHLEEVGPDGVYEGGWKGIYRGGKGQSWDGGIRVPTIVSWPSHIPQGIEITEATSSMDLFTTILGIVGVDGPKDRTIDGKDLMPLLTQKSPVSPHEYLFHYCAKAIHAVRYRPRDGVTTWKAHYITPKWYPGTQACFGYAVCHCYRNVHVHQTPLLFDITQDPSESRPLDSSSATYKSVMEHIDSAVQEHMRGVTQVPDQMDKNFWYPSLQQCCNFPYCSCKEPEKPLKYYPQE